MWVGWRGVGGYAVAILRISRALFGLQHQSRRTATPESERTKGGRPSVEPMARVTLKSIRIAIVSTGCKYFYRLQLVF